MNYKNIEIRKKALFTEIAVRRKNKRPLELIVNIESRKRAKTERELDRIGKVTRFYRHIPYLSFLCSADDAERIATCFYDKAQDRIFSYLGIRAVDLSSTFRANSNKSIKTAVWNLENIGVYDAWAYSKGKGTKIAIIDTGVNYNHPELKERFTAKKGYDFVRDCEEPIDKNGHGTHVAGIAASSNYGIAIEATLYSVRVLDENGSGSEANAIAGIEWCIDNEADIINMSMGGPVASTAFEEICNTAYRKGILIAAATGNTGNVNANYPAAFGESVIAVAAVDRNNEHASFSTIYPTNDISAPGVDIKAPYLDSYAELSGTSMASPHAAGVLALALSLSREKNLEELMKKTSEHLESDLPHRNSWLFGAGLARADRMVGNIDNFLGVFNKYLGNKNLARAAVFARKVWEF